MRTGAYRSLLVWLTITALLVGCGTSAPSLTPATPLPTQAPASTVPSPSPGSSLLPTPTPADPFLGQLVVTVSDRLRVRSQPWVGDGSIKYEPLLPIYTELKVLDGPVEGSGYVWYEVEPLDFTLDGPGYGWVAMAGKDGEPWIGPKPATGPAPPTPTGMTFDVQEKDLGGDRYEKTATVTWRSPRSTEVTIKVYGVTECVSTPPDAEGPCLVVHTPVPSSVLRLAATAPASDGRASWTWIEDYSGGGCQWYPPVSGPDGSWYASVVLAAYNASGHSILAIADPGWEHGPGFFPC